MGEGEQMERSLTPESKGKLSKMDVISEGSILSDNFSKSWQKFILHFIKIFKVFSKSSNQFVFSVQTREILTHGFLKAF